MSLKNRINTSLKNKKLYDNLRTFASAYKQAKANAYAGLDFDQLKTEMNDLKKLDRAKVEELFEEFTLMPANQVLRFTVPIQARTHVLTSPEYAKRKG